MTKQTARPQKNPISQPIAPHPDSLLWKGKKIYFWLGALLLVAGLLRILYLSADPPRDLSWSLSPFTDEGAHALNAKNKLLFGRWQMDEWFRMGVSPFFTLSMYFAFKLFGFGYLVARSLSVIAALGGLLLVFLLLYRSAGPATAVSGGFLMATGYLWTMHNRLATEETTLAFVLLLAVFFWTRKPARLPQAFWAGFLAAGAVFFVKLTGLFFLPVLLLDFFRHRWLKENSEWKPYGFEPLILLLVGGLLAGVIWLVTVYFPFSKATLLMLTATSTQSAGGHPVSVLAFLKNFITLGTADQLVNRLFIPFLLSLFVLLQWCSNLKEKLRRSSDFEFIALSWFIVGSAFLASMNYRPVRYQMILSPAIFILSGLLVGRLLSPGATRTKGQPIWTTWIFRWTVLAWMLYSLLWTVDYFLLTHPSLLSFLSSSPGIWKQEIAERLNNFNRYLPRLIPLSALTAGIWWTANYLRKKRAKVEEIFRPKFGLAMLILLISSAVDFNQFLAWFKNRTYSLVESSRDLRNLPTGSVVAGPWAGSITMEAPVRAVEMQNFCNVDRVLERYPITHLAIFEGGWEHKFFVENYPEELQQSRIWKTYELLPGRLHVLELPRRTQESPP